MCRCQVMHLNESLVALLLTGHNPNRRSETRSCKGWNIHVALLTSQTDRMWWLTNQVHPYQVTTRYYCWRWLYHASWYCILAQILPLYERKCLTPFWYVCELNKETSIIYYWHVTCPCLYERLTVVHMGGKCCLLVLNCYFNIIICNSSYICNSPILAVPKA